MQSGSQRGAGAPTPRPPAGTERPTVAGVTLEPTPEALGEAIRLPVRVDAVDGQRRVGFESADLATATRLVDLLDVLDELEVGERAGEGVVGTLHYDPERGAAAFEPRG